MNKYVLSRALLLFICGIAFILMGIFVETLTHGSLIFHDNMYGFIQDLHNVVISGRGWYVDWQYSLV